MAKTRLRGELLVRFRMDLANVFEETGKQTLQEDPETFWYLVRRTLSREEAVRLGAEPVRCAA